MTTKVRLPNNVPEINQGAVHAELEKFVSSHEVKCSHDEGGGLCRFWDGENSLGTSINYHFGMVSEERYIFVRTMFGSYLPIHDDSFRDGSALPELHTTIEDWLKTVWGIPYSLPVIRTVSGRDVEVKIP